MSDSIFLRLNLLGKFTEAVSRYGNNKAAFVISRVKTWIVHKITIFMTYKHTSHIKRMFGLYIHKLRKSRAPKHSVVTAVMSCDWDFGRL